MKHLLVASLLVFGATYTYASCTPNVRPEKFSADLITPDSTVYTTLGRTMSEVLFNPKKVVLYRLAGKEVISETDYEVEPHYVRDSIYGKVQPEAYSIFLFNVLSDSSNYQLDTLILRAPYIPSYELEFSKGKSVVHIVLSPNDNSWTLIYDDKRQGHWNFADHRFIQRYIAFLLNNKNNTK